MRNHDILLVYYSKAKDTEKVARMICGALECDIEEISESERYAGLPGQWRTQFQSYVGAAPAIERLKKDPSKYRLVIVGSPVLMGNIAAPIRTYLLKKGDQFKAAAFFLTHGFIKEDRALHEMREFCEKAPLTHLSLSGTELTDGSAFGKVKSFTDRLRSVAKLEVEPKSELKPELTIEKVAS